MSFTTPSLATSERRPRRGRRLSRRRLAFAIGGLLSLLVALGGAGALVLQNLLDPGAPVAGVTDVALRDNEFAPAAIEVPIGTTVTWTWDDAEEHNVVGDGFASPVQTDGQFAHAFDRPGTYAYRCTLHFLMRGEVVVVEEGRASAIIPSGP